MRAARGLVLACFGFLLVGGPAVAASKEPPPASEGPPPIKQAAPTPTPVAPSEAPSEPPPWRPEPLPTPSEEPPAEAQNLEGTFLPAVWALGGRGISVSGGPNGDESWVGGTGFALHRDPQRLWGLYAHGSALGVVGGLGAFGGGLTYMRNLGGWFTTRSGLGLGRLTFAVPGYALQSGPALHGIFGLDLHMGGICLSAEVNAFQGAGWSLDGGQNVVYPGRWSLAWLAGLAF